VKGCAACRVLIPLNANALWGFFHLLTLDPVLQGSTWIVPVNITYYPVRARENILVDIARRLVDELPERLIEELMTEGINAAFGGGHRHPLRETTADQRQPQAGCHRARHRAPSRPTSTIPSLHARSCGARPWALMRRYMSCIYGMTTVNHDHLLASLLRRSPYSRIDPVDLCCRAFLLADRLKKLPGIVPFMPPW